MKMPMPPPEWNTLVETYMKSPEGQSRWVEILSVAALQRNAADPYLPWDRLRYRDAPNGFTHEEWWLLVKVRRQALQRELPVLAQDGRPFTFALTDDMLRAVEYVNRHLSGTIGIGERVANAANRDGYLISSLIEEAITSSQLEGASTTRSVAKDMIRSGRSASSRDEQMILNNYAAMLRIGELRSEPVTLDLLRELQGIVTEETLNSSDSSGRFQRPGEDRVGVYDHYNNLLYCPPPAYKIEARMALVCEFINGELKTQAYIPPVILAIVAHFLIGYEHPFEDGNGRTARGLFYWIMLRQDYWLTEFVSISRILRKAPAKYAKSYIYSEQDDNDLTYFILYQLEVIQRAIGDLHLYLERKVKETRLFQRTIAALPGEFNHRQVALLQNAVRKPYAVYTVQSHRTSHNVTRQTARQDLFDLENRSLLMRQTEGRKFLWRSAPDLEARLSRHR